VPDISAALPVTATTSAGNGVGGGIFTDKTALRKHHSSNPYEMFNNETSYSSDDSIPNFTTKN
jgi:hypothetical protein